MKKTSLYIEPHVDRALARRAAERGVSKAEYIRGVLGEAARSRRRPTPRGRAIFEGPADLGENLERHLRESRFGEE